MANYRLTPCSAHDVEHQYLCRSIHLNNQNRKTNSHKLHLSPSQHLFLSLSQPLHLSLSQLLFLSLSRLLHLSLSRHLFLNPSLFLLLSRQSFNHRVV